ncbi:OsmC family protein [Luteimonas sp. RD2P54]|uniref:OsmC family protein n=1 Tax=Luteimonas endophytica TaxID=3042023 RepID=A0ABT6J4N5_9GAMM|nr:OsmC family protein [Luteimonas endophytica]MDH5821772.1 OsmC family protein [Luteimonas endophytica]
MSEDRPVKVILEQEDGYAFRIRFEGDALEPLLGDEPPPLGEGRGPDPARLLLAAIANCLSASLVFALRKYKNQPGAVRAEITAAPVRNPEGRWRIPQAEVEIQLAEGEEAHQHLERILEQFEQFCIVTQSVREGIDVGVTVRDAHGNVLLGDRSFEAGA